ncbi:disease resistance TIR-NBS-LRR class family protein [Tanacetum coccineum]
MECQKMTGHTAYPVFYDVEPTEVRKQIGAVGKAFAKHKKEAAARKWREALKEAADLAGFELESMANGHEATFIQVIIEKISMQVDFNNSSSDGDLIGMETRVNKVISSLEPGVGDARMLGIWGMGGAGKTTLARAIFDQISIQFDGASFIYNVREVSKATSEGLKKLQKEVVSEVLKDKNIDVSGNSMMQRRMRGIKVLIVLDDVDHKDQLEALAGDLNWFKPGSRIIITTRDKQVLTAHGVELIQNVTLLSEAEAGCLFSRYAFGRENPIQGYEELSGKVLQYAGGLPLTIKVMGSHLRGLDESEWKNAIKRLETIPFEDTMKVLELSYDALEEDCKQIFLDVACILKGWFKEEAIRALESRGFYGVYGLRVLEQKSLITISKDDIFKGSISLGMHDHLQEMGRNIVRRSHPYEPQRHSRLWFKEEIEYILTNKLGTPATQCLQLWSSSFSAEITMKGLAKMKNLKVLFIEVLDKCDDNSIKWKFDKVSEYLPSSLRFMSWSKYPFSNLPNTFKGENLVQLKLEYSNVVQLWEDGEAKVLNNLRFLDIYDSKLRTFDLRLAPNLEELTINFCFDFVELHIPAGHHSKLKYICIQYAKMTNLHLGNTRNLEKLNLNGCVDLVELEMPAESLKLKELNLSHSKSKTIHLGSTPNLEELILNGCYNLVELEMPAESLKLEHLNLSHSKLKTIQLRGTPNLVKLILKGCNDLVELEMPAKCLNLEKLNLSHSKLRTHDLGLTPNLKWLRLKNCYDLVELKTPVGCLSNLAFLDLSGCGSFKSFLFDKQFDSDDEFGSSLSDSDDEFGSSLSDSDFEVGSSSNSHEVGSLSELHLISEPKDVCPLHPDNDSPKFQFSCYYKEDRATSFGNLERLISIGLSACTNLESFSRSICSLQYIRKLKLEVSITEAPRDLDQLECLEELTFSSTEIKYLPDNFCKLKHLKSFNIKSCWLLEKLPEDIGRLESLETLILTDCKLLQDIPNSICKMKYINKLHLRFCIRVVELPEEIGSLEGLKELNIEGTGITRLPQSIFRLRGLCIVGPSMWLLDTYGLFLKRRRISDDDERVCYI